MIYILATQNVLPGKMAEYEAASKEMAPVRKKVGMNLVGAWRGYSGNINQVFSLFAYKDLAEFQKMRETRQKDPEYMKGAAKMQTLISDSSWSFIEPVSWSPMK